MLEETNKIQNKKYYIRMILFLTLSILINIAVNRFVGYMGLPLYLDNIGTLIAAAVGGYLPGIIVGYVTNIVNMSGNPDTA